MHASGWRVLDKGTTDRRGRVRLRLDLGERASRDGFNHRLRVDPPKTRRDLAPTWRVWMPKQQDVFRLSQNHVVEGTVVDGQVDVVPGATVFLGDMPSSAIAVTNPDWMNTTTDPEGRFRFHRIPTTVDWRIDVWAIGPGEAKPRTSRDVKGAQSVALDSRAVRIQLR